MIAAIALVAVIRTPYLTPARHTAPPAIAAAAKRVLVTAAKRRAVPKPPETRIPLGTFSATAYSYSYEDPGAGSSDWCANGERVGVGKIAVDPRVIPLGTQLFVEGYGYCHAADTGGAIKGRRIDVFLTTNAACNAWGRRSVRVWKVVQP